MIDMLTDEQLMEQLRSGETDAIDELYQRYARTLYAFCYSITRSEAAEDLVHDVFMRVITSARRFNPGRASFRTWVFRIARNRCVDFVRRREKVRFVPIGGGAGQDDEENSLQNTIMDDRANAEEAMVNASVIEAVRECIDELNNDQEKHAIVLYYMAGKVYREIGEILGRSTSMAKNRVKSAQDKVKRCLERKDIDSFP
jgi:RNA polymerase sigma factor (sigma-70 family)